jgi:hypothetical protein
MAITTPATIGIATPSSLWLPDVAIQPLRAALENINYLMQYHRPPLVSHCYTAEDALTRASSYIIPVIASADSLRYTFEHRFTCSAASQSVTVTVDETATYAGGATTWSNIYSQAVTTSGSAGGLTTHTKTLQPITSTTTALRITYTAPASGSRNDHHVIAYPAPAAPSAGLMPSGATPFDDGLITSADLAAVHTEWINRCKVTASAVLRDRKQIALSFLQDETSQAYTHDSIGTAFHALPAVRVWLANQGPAVTLDLRVLASVDGGLGTDLIRIRQSGGVPGAVSTIFDASGSIESGTLALVMQGDGLMRHADIEIAVARTAGNRTRLKSVSGFYTPGQ